jgi:hypothetical protein
MARVVMQCLEVEAAHQLVIVLHDLQRGLRETAELNGTPTVLSGAPRSNATGLASSMGSVGLSRAAVSLRKRRTEEVGRVSGRR